MVKINYYATLRTSLGIKSEDLEFQGNLYSLLISLEEIHGKNFKDKIKRGDVLIPGVIILLNGISIRYDDFNSTYLNENDVIDIFPPVAGG